MKSYSSRNELNNLFVSLMNPLKPFFDGKGKLKFGSHGTVYSETAREVEAFLRPLWGFGPHLVFENDNELLEYYMDGIVSGTSPNSDYYWGDVTDYDQLIVEMASLSTCFLLNKEKMWDRFSDIERYNIHRWLIFINNKDIPRNNWHFFRILVNLSMKQCGMSYSQEMIDEDFNTINSFYKGDGWYYDGEETQYDYYVSFAIHYYSLVYMHFTEDEEPERASIIKDRATQFAQTFKYWFDGDGEALPFGRSLTYRFAQVSFFSALVFANVEALPWGEIKGIISRHFSNWMDKEILTSEGLLTVGYHYENLVFAEGYNGFGSPYWSFKSFILLAVPDSHPFWDAQEMPLRVEKRTKSSPISKNFYQYNKDLSHLQAFPAGQFVRNQNFPHAKYSKFVYSTKFGFSVPKSDYQYYEGAYDSTLAVSKDEYFFRPKNLDTDFSIQEDRIVHVWNPWSDVTIKSTIVPLDNCHVRIHEIKTIDKLNALDGAFSIPFHGVIPETIGITAEAKSEIGTSRIDGVEGYSSSGIERLEPNTNLFFQRTMLPYLKAEIEPGTHCLISVVYGLMPDEIVEEPNILFENNHVIIHQKNKVVRIQLS